MKEIWMPIEYEGARFWLGRLLEFFLERSSERGQILEPYTHIDYVSQALFNVPAAAPLQNQQSFEIKIQLILATKVG
jgi:hypothetical protein